MRPAPSQQVPFDAMALRAQFPILARSVHGRPLVYFDNAASAQKPRAVIAAMTHFIEHDYANVHRGLHALSTAATDAYEDARGVVRQFLNAAHTDEIIFTGGTTDAINLVANSLGQSIGPGDEIILSEMEHHSNIVPWHFLRERKGAVIRWAPIDDDGALDMAAFGRLFGPRTRIVAVTHMSNVLGTLTLARAIADIAHAHGVPVLLDGSQAAVHGAVDVQALDCDFYAVTGHKLYGPTGIGALYGKRARLQSMPPFKGGGEMIREVHKDAVTYGALPHRFEAGTPPIIEAVGFGAALRFLMGLDRAALIMHEAALLNHAEGRMRALPWLQIQGCAAGKGPILSFTMDGAHAHDVATVVDRSGVAIRAGHHCAQPLMERLGLAATARASFAPYNTLEEVDVFIEALKRARSIFS